MFRHLVCWFCLTLAPWAHAGSIAFSFDDAPRRSTNVFSGYERADRLLQQLHHGDVKQAVFFTNTGFLGFEGRGRLMKYVMAGHVLANHTHSHLDLRTTTPESFIRDIEKAHEVLSVFPNFRQWFRFPFLHEGDSWTDRDEVRHYLQAQGYKNGYVTVDTADFYMDELLQNAVAEGKTIQINKLKQAYAQIIWDSIRFYDALALQVMKRSPKHILLLRENDLAALCLDALIAKIRASGWHIITADEAYQDPIAETEPNTLALAQGRISALAHQNGQMTSLSSPWKQKQAIESEFARRKVFEAP